MGKATRFLKSLLGFKTPDSQSQPSRSQSTRQLNRRWSFAKPRDVNSGQPRRRNASKSLDGNSIQHSHHVNPNENSNEDPNKQAIALVAATAAVVDAAVAAAHAAAEVVRMTSRTAGGGGYGVRHELAAVKIQSHFRAYLARRALRALKALVKLQAVVRGHILRKQTADMMRRLQALIRVQARARALRSQIADSSSKSSSGSHFHHHGPPTPEKLEHFPHTKYDNRSISKRNNSKSYARGMLGQERTFLDYSTDHEHDKIVEVDIGESCVMPPNGRRLFQPDQLSQSLTTSRTSTIQPTSASPCASCEVTSFDGSTRGGVSTPVKSDGSRSCFSSYSDHPNYMANTQSSRAKARSLSAPRLRSLPEAYNATKKDPGHKYASGIQQVPTMRESFAKKTYPGSGRLDRLGMPVYETAEVSFVSATGIDIITSNGPRLYDISSERGHLSLL